jgi:V-type H+-transporting ATPase subunit D
LDELDREEFYRLKKVSGKKKGDYEAAEKIRLAAKSAKAQEEVDDDAGGDPEDLLGDKDNEDVIF